MTLEGLRRNPLRYGIPNGLSALRPILGWYGMKDARNGDWKKARNKFTSAAVTDMEGYPARFLNATSEIGAVIDPVADFGLRLELVAAFVPVMSKIALGIIGAAELDNLRLNAKIQKGKKSPTIPKGAKWGTAIQGIGATLFCEGMERNNTLLKRGGEFAMVSGSVGRNLSYRNLYKREKAV